MVQRTMPTKMSSCVNKFPNIGVDRSEQTVQIQIRLLPKEQSDLGLHCFPSDLHLLDILMHCKTKPFPFYK